jgi:L-ascorbate metabolism protein UlaG (beta-lactamase superfamily)
MVVSLKWFPPSWIQIKADSKIIYIDPAYLRTYYLRHSNKIEFTKWPQPIDGLPEKLEKADLILITHDHKDHAKDVTIRRLCTKDTRLIGPLRCQKKLEKDMTVITAGQEIAFKDIHVEAVEAYNQKKSGSGKIWHPKGSGVGYLITVADRRIYHAGDTDFIPDMKQLGPVDLALLPIGGTYTMDLDAAVQAALTIQPQVVVPMHHLKADPQKFKSKIEENSGIKCAVLQIGEPFSLS